jgi:hypothetical protein
LVNPVNTTWETIINPHIILYSIISIVDNHIGDLVCLVSYKIATDMSRGDLMEVIAFTASPMELSILRALNLECVRGECKNDAISAQLSAQTSAESATIALSTVLSHMQQQILEQLTAPTLAPHRPLSEV